MATMFVIACPPTRVVRAMDAHEPFFENYDVPERRGNDWLKFDVDEIAGRMQKASEAIYLDEHERFAIWNARFESAGLLQRLFMLARQGGKPEIRPLSVIYREMAQRCIELARLAVACESCGGPTTGHWSQIVHKANEVGVRLNAMADGAGCMKLVDIQFSEEIGRSAS